MHLMLVGEGVRQASVGTASKERVGIRGLHIEDYTSLNLRIFFFILLTGLGALKCLLQSNGLKVIICTDADDN